jgi:putative peptidoglycan lipid II flippase
VIYVWGILAGAAVGLLAATLGRLYASAYYALGDTRTPLSFAIARIALGIGLRYMCAIRLPPMLGIDAHWGVAGLAFAAGVAGWVEFALLRRTLNRRINHHTGLLPSLVAKLWSAAVAGSAAAWAIKLALGPQHPVLAAVLVLSPYGLLYFGITYTLGVPEAKIILGRLARLWK